MTKGLYHNNLTLTAILLTLFSYNFAYSFVVTGDIKDTNGLPVEFASVRIMSNDSTMITGMQTNAGGEYALCVTDSGSYIIHVSMLGYEPTSITTTISSDTNIASITIKESTNTLNEVTVIGRNITRVNDHLQIIPDATSIKHAFTSYQLLDNIMIPGLKVDTQTGSVSMFSKSVGLFINNEPADYLMVKNLRPRDIEKIEFYDAPSGQFSQYSAVVNFIVKEDIVGGYLALDATQQIGNADGNYNAYSQTVIGKNKIHVFGGYNFTVKDIDNTFTSEIFHFASGDIERSTPNNGRSHNYGEYGGIKFSHSGKTNSFSINAQVLGQNSRQRINTTTSYGEPYNMIEDVTNQTSGSGISPKISIWDYKKLSEDAYIQFKIDAAYSKNKSYNNYIQNTNSVLTDISEDNYTLNTNIYIGKSIKKVHSLSLHISDDYQNSLAKYYGDYPSTQRIWRSELLTQIEYKATIKRLNITFCPGISIIGENNVGETATVVNPRLDARIVWTPTSNQQLILNGLTSNTSPALSQKTAGETAVDILQVRRGNPFIKEAKMYSAGFIYNIQLNKIAFTLMGAFHNFHNYTTAWYYLDKGNQDNDILVYSYQNNSTHYDELDFSTTWDICKYIKANVVGMLLHQSYGNLHNNYLNGRLTIFAVYKGFSFKAYGYPRSTNLSVELKKIRTEPIYGFALDWNNKNWNIEGTIDNPFNRKKYYQTTFTPDYFRERWYSRKRFASLKIAYTFDFGNKKLNKEEKASIRHEFDSAIIK